MATPLRQTRCVCVCVCVCEREAYKSNIIREWRCMENLRWLKVCLWFYETNKHAFKVCVCEACIREWRWRFRWQKISSVALLMWKLTSIRSPGKRFVVALESEALPLVFSTLGIVYQECKRVVYTQVALSLSLFASN